MFAIRNLDLSHLSVNVVVNFAPSIGIQIRIIVLSIMLL